jgi:hypothetical protein
MWEKTEYDVPVLPPRGLHPLLLGAASPGRWAMDVTT